MEITVECNTTTAPTSSSAPVPTHALKPAPTHTPAADHLGGGGPVIVQALRAPGTGAERQRQTFWTACTSCNQKNKYPIKDLSCLLSCLHCSMKFTAVEVPRPRNKGGAISQPGALISLSGKAGAASDHASSSVLATKSVNVAPPRKKVRRGSNMTQVALGDNNIQGKLNAQKRVACMHHNNVGGRIHHKGPMHNNNRRQILYARYNEAFARQGQGNLGWENQRSKA